LLVLDEELEDERLLRREGGNAAGGSSHGDDLTRCKTGVNARLKPRAPCVARLKPSRSTRRPVYPIVPTRRKLSISSALNPASRSTASVCSPSIGARREESGGVPLILIGDPSAFRWPSVGCSTSTTIPRAATCGSWNTPA